VKALPTALLLAAALLASPARASVELRVLAQPINQDIQALVIVTDAGVPVAGLTADDFSLRLDGIPISASAFTRPPSQDSTQKVSVVFVMDYSSSVQTVARDATETAVKTFIDEMQDGDFAAIIKFNETLGATLVQEFTAIDDNSGAGVGTAALIAAVETDYPGNGSPVLNATYLGIDQFITTNTLPPGPKSVIVVSDGGENGSDATQSDVVDYASGNSIPIFTIGVGDVTGAGGLVLLATPATETGGDYIPAPDNEAIADAYDDILALLSNEYQLTIPASAVTDCAEHTLEVTVAGPAPGSASVTFERCDTTPDPLIFTNQTGVATGATVTSSPITISGIDGPANIVVSEGEYSIGCGADDTFSTTPGTISNGQTVCVRHTAASAPSTDTTTTLTVGGVSGTFTSTTSATPPSSGGGGGGALGIVELCLGLTALWCVRRRRQSSSQIRIT